MATEPTGRRLAPSPSYRDRIGVQSAPITEEIQKRRRRVAWCELFTDAPRKPDHIYEQQRRDPRYALPDERQHEQIRQGIRDGYISRERLIHYRVAQLLDDLAAFTTPAPSNERLLAVMMREIGEGAEWALVAEATPSAENCMRASQELKQAAALCLVQAVTVERGPIA